MNKQEYYAAAQNIIYLASCMVNDRVPDRTRIQEMNLEHVYQVAEKHLLASITAYALAAAGVKHDKFMMAQAKAMRKNIILDRDRTALLAFLEKEGIWYMPLKGAILKEYYPKSDMRQMSDNDILFDQTYRAQVKAYFESSGFVTDHYLKGLHDVYMKEPVSNFEMHVSLFTHTIDEKIYNYYENVKERLIPDKPGGFGYHFTDEDFYIYIIAHEYKHYYKGGTGIRSLLDTYVYMQKFGDTLDDAYIQKEVEKLGISDFEKKNRSLALNLFGNGELTDENKEMLEYIIDCGAYGSADNFIKNKVTRNGTSGKDKINYLKKRLFFPMPLVKEYYPFFYKHKILLPFLLFYRLGRAMTVSRSKVSKEIKIMCQTESKTSTKSDPVSKNPNLP